MKYLWSALNTCFILLLVMYLFITKDINTKAYDECKRFEEKVALQDKMIENLTEIATQKDTIVVNIRNYSIKNYTNNNKDED